MDQTLVLDYLNEIGSLAAESARQPPRGVGPLSPLLRTSDNIEAALASLRS